MELPRRKLLQTAGVTIGAGTVLAGMGGSAVAEESVDGPADDEHLAHASNYESADRTADDIDWIVIRGTYGSYDAALNWYQESISNVSTHYLIRDDDGHTTKVVDESDVAWHAGDRELNERTISIDHEYVSGQETHSTAAYESSAAVIDHLIEAYDIPRKYYVGRSSVCNADGGVIEARDLPRDEECSGSQRTPSPGDAWNGTRLRRHIDLELNVEIVR